MKKVITCIGIVAALAVPAVAGAAKPNKADRSAAKAECKALLKAEGTSNFKHAWGAKGKGRAYGKCVSSTAREEARERQAAHRNAAKDCKDEQAMSDEDFMAGHDGKTFAEAYGAKNEHQAFGKCVSTKAKENKEAMDEADEDQVNAAKMCRDEQTADRDAFKENYRNFGKCVSKKAHELNAERKQADTETQS